MSYIIQQFLIPFFDMCPVCGESQNLLMIGEYDEDDLEYAHSLSYFVICLSCGFYNESNSDNDFIWLGWFDGMYSEPSYPPHNNYPELIWVFFGVDSEDDRYGVDYTISPTSAQEEVGTTIYVTFTIKPYTQAFTVNYRIETDGAEDITDSLLLSNGTPPVTITVKLSDIMFGSTVLILLGNET